MTVFFVKVCKNRKKVCNDKNKNRNCFFKTILFTLQIKNKHDNYFLRGGMWCASDMNNRSHAFLC